MTKTDALVHITCAILANPRTDPQYSPEQVAADADNVMGALLNLADPHDPWTRPDAQPLSFDPEPGQ